MNAFDVAHPNLDWPHIDEEWRYGEAQAVMAACEKWAMEYVMRRR